MMRNHIFKILAFVLLFLFSQVAFSCDQQSDWKKAQERTVQLFREYLTINTCNPPGDVSAAAEFFKSVFEKEGVPV